MLDCNDTMLEINHPPLTLIQHTRAISLDHMDAILICHAVIDFYMLHTPEIKLIAIINILVPRDAENGRAWYAISREKCKQVRMVYGVSLKQTWL